MYIKFFFFAFLKKKRGVEESLMRYVQYHHQQGLKQQNLTHDHDQFCLDRSLFNFSKPPLGNNIFMIETLFFFSKMLSSTDRKTFNLLQ